MPRSNRIKLSSFTATIDSTSNLAEYSDAINGEILEVDYTFNRTGSIWLAVSGTNSELFRRNAPSGTATGYAYPRVFGELTTGSVANASQFPRVVNSPLFFGASGVASGTQQLVVNVRYR